MNQKVKTFISTLLKLCIAVGLVFWLIKSGKLDLSLLSKLLTFDIVAGIMVLALLPVVINNYRWQTLMNYQNFGYTYKETLPLTFIGLFFNFAMPGGVGGDVVKGYYLIQDQKDRKLLAATSIILDRLIGFFVMTFLAAVALLFDISEILQRPALVTLSFIILGLFFGFCFFFAVCFSRRISKNKLLQVVFERVPGGGTLKKLYDAVHGYRNNISTFYFACLLSVFGQVSMIFFFIWVGHKMGGSNISWQTYALVVPVGLIATSMPISIAGVGVGQVVFMKLFNWNLGYDTPIAPAIITAYQISMFGWGLIGVYFFLKRKRPKSFSELSLS